jgi:outer membrane receptor for ferrienterochelin and colicin
MRRLALLPSVLLLLGASFATSPAFAQSDTSDLQSLLDQSVVTTASKSAETSTTAPATSSTLTAEDIRRYGLHSIAEAIDFLSLGVVTANPLGSAEVGARGVLLSADSGDHFLLLVDGHAVNEPLFGTARFDQGAGIPIEMVDHIEVILGPGSVLYGSNAMLGVINVITKRAKDWHGTHIAVEGWGGPTQVDSANLAAQSPTVRSNVDLPSGWQSATGVGPTAWRAMAGAGYEVPLFGKTAEITVAVEYFKQDGPAFTFGPQASTTKDVASGQPLQFTRPPLPATGVWGGLADQDYYVREPGAQLHVVWGNFDLGVHASIYQRASPYRARYNHPVQDFNDPDSNDTDRSLWVDLKHHATLSAVVQLRSRAYADTWDYEDIQNASEASVCFTDFISPTCTYRGRFASRWIGLEEQLSFDWFKDASFVTLVGADGRLRHVGSKLDFLDFATRQPLRSSDGVIDQDDYALGVYAQQTWQPARWLGLNAGARLDQETRYTGNVSPRVAASVGAWTGATFKAIYAEAFRAPSWTETNLYSVAQLPGGNLSPEHVRSVEASFEQRFGSQHLLAGVFRSWWSNLVALHALTPAEIQAAAQAGQIDALRYSGFVQFRNVDSIDNYGINAEYGGSAGDSQQFRWGATATAAIARLVDTTQPGAPSVPLTVGPQVFGNARVSYDLPGDWPTLGVATHWMGKRYADRAWDGAWPSYQIPVAPPQVELRGTINGPVPGIKGLSYRMSVNWAMASLGPYVVGSAQSAPYKEGAERVPVDPLRVMLGLQYDLLP